MKGQEILFIDERLPLLDFMVISSGLPIEGHNAYLHKTFFRRTIRDMSNSFGRSRHFFVQIQKVSLLFAITFNEESIHEKVTKSLEE